MSGAIEFEVPDDDPERMNTQRPRRGDVLVGGLRQHQRPAESGEHRQLHDGEDPDHVEEGRARDRDDRHCEDDRRKGDEDIHHPHQRFIGETAGIGGRDPDRGADDGPKRRRGEAHRQRYAGADEDAGEEVPAEFVGAHEVCE